MGHFLHAVQRARLRADGGGRGKEAWESAAAHKTPAPRLRASFSAALRARTWSSVSSDGLRPPCRQKILPATSAVMGK